MRSACRYLSQTARFQSFIGQLVMLDRMLFDELRVSRWQVRFSPGIAEDRFQGLKVAPHADEEEVAAIGLRRPTREISQKPRLVPYDGWRGFCELVGKLPFLPGSGSRLENPHDGNTGFQFVVAGHNYMLRRY